MIIFAYSPPPLYLYMHIDQLNTREGGSLQILTVIKRDSVTLSSTINQSLSYHFWKKKKASRNSLGHLFYSWILGSYWVIPNYLMEKKTNMDNTSLFAISNASITPQWLTQPSDSVSIVNALIDNTDLHCLLRACTPLTIKTNHCTSVSTYWRVKIQEMEITPWIKFLFVGSKLCRIKTRINLVSIIYLVHLYLY